MKPGIFLLAVSALSISVFSCKKSDQEKTKVDDAVLEVTVEGATQISTGVQYFMLSSITVALDSGYYAEIQSLGSRKKALRVKDSFDFSWSGPDADGWYTRIMSGTYDYYEKVRYRDTIDYIITMS
jgi:hypothetical protein